MVRTSIQHRDAEARRHIPREADAEPAILRERGDEFLRKPYVAVTFSQ